MKWHFWPFWCFGWFGGVVGLHQLLGVLVKHHFWGDASVWPFGLESRNRNIANARMFSRSQCSEVALPEHALFCGVFESPILGCWSKHHFWVDGQIWSFCHFWPKCHFRVNPDNTCLNMYVFMLIHSGMQFCQIMVCQVGCKMALLAILVFWWFWGVLEHVHFGWWWRFGNAHV